MKRDLLGPALLVAHFLGGCGGGNAAHDGPRSVVLICLDTVRADHLGTYGYGRDTTPSIDALARRSVVFTRTSSTAGWTKPSVPSYLTGTYPMQHGVYEGSAHGDDGDETDLLPDSALTLAEVFQARGYRTAAFVHNAQLRAGNGFEQGFDLYDEGNMDAREIRWRGLDWLDRERAADPETPFFLYLHFLDAHWPYPAPEEWITKFAPAAETERFRGDESKALYTAINSGEHAMTPSDQAALEALYDGALAYLDSQLGRLFEGLELRGLAADTVVCIVADHGEEFGEHGRVGHGHGLWENLLHVPWVLHVPGTAPARNDARVSLIDLFPTLLAAAGLVPAADLEGVNRLASPRDERPILAEHKAPDRYFQALREGDEKLVRIFSAPAEGLGDVPELPVSVGTRWEVEFALRDGALVAQQLKPRDEEPDDPPELKGPIEALGESDFRIGGQRVRYDSRSRRQTEPGTQGPELAEGVVVKVRGPIDEAGMLAERIKFYAPGENTQLELRGTVEGIERSGRTAVLRIGGQSVRVTSSTDFKGVEGVSRKNVLQREAIATLLDAGAGPAGTEAGFEIRRTRLDLARDPQELGGEAAEAGSRLEGMLDELGARLAARRVFGAGDRKALDSDAIRALQDIGYGGGGH